MFFVWLRTVAPLIPVNNTFDSSLLHVEPFVPLEWFLAQNRRSCGLVCMLWGAPPWFQGVELLHVCSQLGAKKGAIERSWGYTMIIRCQKFRMIIPIFQAQLPWQLVTWKLKNWGSEGCGTWESSCDGEEFGATRSPTASTCVQPGSHFGVPSFSEHPLKSWECWWKKSSTSCFQDMQNAKLDMFHWYSDYQLVNWIAEPSIYFGGWQTL